MVYRYGALLVTAMVLSAGCQEPTAIYEGPAPAIRTTADSGIGHTQTLNTVVFLDDSLQVKLIKDEFGQEYPVWPWRSSIAVEATDSRRTPTDTLEVWAIFRNRSGRPVQLEARTAFYDAYQAPLGAPSAWQRIHLPPNSTHHYSERSLNIDVGYYRIEVREGR